MSTSVTLSLNLLCLVLPYSIDRNQTTTDILRTEKQLGIYTYIINYTDDLGHLTNCYQHSHKSSVECQICSDVSFCSGNCCCEEYVYRELDSGVKWSCMYKYFSVLILVYIVFSFTLSRRTRGQPRLVWNEDGTLPDSPIYNTSQQEQHTVSTAR